MLSPWPAAMPATTSHSELAPQERPCRRALLLANDRARRSREGLRQAKELLRGSGVELIFHRLPKRKRMREMIRRHKDFVDAVIVAGGDGTLNSVVDSLVEFDLPLAVLPLGTANDLARTLGIPASVEAACEVIAAGHTRRIDLGWVNGKHFFNVASLGVSVALTRELTREVKRRWGVLAYMITGMNVMRRSRPFHATVRSGDQVWKTRTVQIAVGNGRFYGGGMVIAEDAAIDDQRLDLYSLELNHWWQIVPLLLALRKGRLANRSSVRAAAGTEFEVHTRRPRPINTDGEITTRTPAVFRVVPAALRVYTPATAIPATGSNPSEPA